MPRLEDEWNFTAFQLSEAYSLYSFPNLVVPVVCGILVDKGPFFLDLRFFLVFTTSLILTGSVCMAISAQANGVIPLFLAGRFILGCGGETCLSTQCRSTANLFPTNQCATVCLPINSHFQVKHCKRRIVFDGSSVSILPFQHNAHHCREDFLGNCILGELFFLMCNKI